MPDFRPIPQSRSEEVQEILQYAFMPEHGPDPDAYTLSWPSELFDLYGLFDGDELVSVCKLHYLETTIRGESTTMGGIGGVATAPERRREGHVRQLLRAALDVYREDDVPVATLWPYETSFYRHLGWGTTNTFTTYELPPEELAFARDSEGVLRRLTADDWERLRAVEEKHAEGTGLALRRSEEWWRKRTLSEWASDGTPYIYGYERDGRLQGYVTYTIDESEVTSAHDGPRLRVQDLAYVDDDAYRGLLAFLADQDSQVGVVRLRRPEESDLLHRVDNPERVDATLALGPMARLTDVTATLERFPWPASLSVEWTLEVTDPLLPCNDGRFTVDVDAGSATVTPTDGKSGDDAAITVDIGTLSQLYVGTFDVESAERLGTLDVDESVRDALWTAFTPEDVCLREFF